LLNQQHSSRYRAWSKQQNSRPLSFLSKQGFVIYGGVEEKIVKKNGKTIHLLPFFSDSTLFSNPLG
jgi:hypothetical protein